MNESTVQREGSSEAGLKAVHRQWVLVTIRKLRLIYPELTFTLYGAGLTFTIHVANCDTGAFAALVEEFDRNIRPATCHIILTQQTPQVSAPIEEANDYDAELWLNGEPLPVRHFNILLWLAQPNLPAGGIDFDNTRDTWVFRSFTALTDHERICVENAARRAGIIGPVECITVSPPAASAPLPAPVLKLQGDLTIAVSRQIAPGTVRNLLQEDEDAWRAFLARRAVQEIVAPEPLDSSSFTCLYDMEHCGESRLSELLTLYDRVDILPEPRSFAWSAKHQVSLPDLQELVRLKRVRLILPYSVVDYPAELLEAIAEVDRSAVVLSRELAIKTIARGQAKEPFLYAPLTSVQRAAVLAAMSRCVNDARYRGLLSSYGRLSCRQHDLFMTHGALASLHFGVGAYLGDAFFKLANKDARLELTVCGAGIEWALGLGASYIPRNFGGFDETWNSQIIASYLGRTGPQRRADPVADRMHAISDGLLAVSNVPPLEVAKSLDSLRASRFRNLARRLMEATPDTEELEDAVEKINTEVKIFERRAERLARWKLHTIVKEAGIAAVAGAWGVLASLSAAWLYEMLEDRIPVKVRAELSDARAMLTGLATCSSLDAVIVSRSRQAIGKERSAGGH